MPNYMASEITIQGPMEELINFYARCGEEFKFDTFLPVPHELTTTEVYFDREAALFVWDLDHPLDDKPPQSLMELIDICSTWKEVLANAQKKYRAAVENPEGLASSDGVHILSGDDYIALGQKALSNINKYGACTLYDWCISNWGVKWDVDECIPSEPVENPNTPGHGSIFMSFMTAWNFPEAAFTAISKQYPSLEITGSYASDVIGTDCGEVAIHNGNAIFTNRSGDIEFANGLWGMDLDYEEEDQ